MVKTPLYTVIHCRSERISLRFVFYLVLNACRRDHTRSSSSHELAYTQGPRPNQVTCSKYRLGPCVLRIDHKEFVLYMYSNSIAVHERAQLVECGSKMQVVIYAGEWHLFATLLYWVS